MAFSSTSRRRLFPLRHPVVVDVGCSCRRAKLSSLFSYTSFSSSSSSITAALSSTKKMPSQQLHKAKPNPQAPSKHRHPLSSYYPFSPSTSTTAASSSGTNATTTATTVSVSPWDYYGSLNPSSTCTTATSPYEDYYYSYYNTSYYSGLGYSDYSCSGGSAPGSGKLSYGSAPAAAAGSGAKSNKKGGSTTKPASAAAAAPRGKKEPTAGGGRVAEESVAVVKDSSNPYDDFRDSMLQMILEKEIYAWDDLRDLLHRFLSLNAPYHHDSIVRAFTEIWNGVFCADAAGDVHGRSGGGGSSRRKSHNYHHRQQQQQKRQHGHHHRLSRDPPVYGA